MGNTGRVGDSKPATSAENTGRPRGEVTGHLQAVSLWPRKPPIRGRRPVRQPHDLQGLDHRRSGIFHQRFADGITAM